MIKVLGVDVGTAIVGWSVVQYAPKSRNQMKIINYGVIRTSSKQDMPERLGIIWQELTQIIKDYEPCHAAVESLFYFKNQTTVMSVSQARGAILLACQQSGLRIAEYTPLQVKTGVTGYGRANKEQVQKMVKLILGLSEIPKPDDAADALAIAINHLNVIPVKEKQVKNGA
mgnify:CR=1 FL=1